MNHHLKTWPSHFEAVEEGKKPFEVRKDDRGGFCVGDTLTLEEWNPSTEKYTGRKMVVEVTYVTLLPFIPGYMGMTIKKVN